MCILPDTPRETRRGGYRRTSPNSTCEITANFIAKAGIKPPVTVAAALANDARAREWSDSGTAQSPTRRRRDAPLAHSVKQLEKKGLTILLPFYILKLREEVEKAAPGIERKKLSVPLRKLLDELAATVDVCKQKGAIDEKDVHGIIKALDFLYQELYSQYKELAQEDSMLKEKLFETGQDIAHRAERRGERRANAQASLKIAKNLLALGDSPERVTKATGLPLAKVKALLKTTKMKQIA
jgi:hypothetical protein